MIDLPALQAPSGIIIKDRQRHALAEFQQRLHRTVPPDQIVSLILFGSQARGETHLHSDIDLLLVTETLTPEQDEAIAVLMGDILSEIGVDTTVITWTQEEASEQAQLGTPLARNIAAEGVVLEGRPLVVGQGKPEEVAWKFLEGARQRLRSAEVLLREGLYRDSVSRAFYAFLDAADGALATKRIAPKSHSGTVDLFSMHFIKNELVDRKYGRWFKRIRKARLEADYSHERIFTEQEAAIALNQATEFVAAIEKLLPTLLAESQPEGKHSDLPGKA
jgi:hypothetical protein